MLRTVVAPNPSPLTLDGTRTYIIGSGSAVIIDPGSDDPDHLDAIAEAVGDGSVTAILVTHGHPDHLGGSAQLGERLHAPVRRVGDGSLHDGDSLETDAGAVVAVATPGHTSDHASFHWPGEGAVFCGDLMLGGADTALVAPPEGRLGPYLASLELLRQLQPEVIYPAHGPAFTRPAQALDRYVRHRDLRLQQVMEALDTGAKDYNELRLAVYGDSLEAAIERLANKAIKAYLEYLQGQGKVRRKGHGWELRDG